MKLAWVSHTQATRVATPKLRPHLAWEWTHLVTQACRRRLASVIGWSACMFMRRTTRRAQKLEAPAVVIGALLSALARRIHRRCRQMRLAAGPTCIRRVSPRASAHHPALYNAHGHMQRRAYMHALADVYMRNVAYAHSTSLTSSRSDTLVRTCAHAHAHSQTDRFTHTDGISQERHTQTHTCTHMHTRTYTQLPTYTHTHMNTHRHTKEHARTHTYTQTFVCICDTTHMHTRACTKLPTYTHTHMNTHRHTKEHALIQTYTHSCTRTHKHTHKHTETGYHMNKTHTDTRIQKPDHTYIHTYPH